jgi:hypothetical protein
MRHSIAFAALLVMRRAVLSLIDAIIIVALRSAELKSCMRVIDHCLAPDEPAAAL